MNLSHVKNCNVQLTSVETTKIYASCNVCTCLSSVENFFYIFSTTLGNFHQFFDHSLYEINFSTNSFNGIRFLWKKSQGSGFMPKWIACSSMISMYKNNLDFVVYFFLSTKIVPRMVFVWIWKTCFFFFSGRQNMHALSHNFFLAKIHLHAITKINIFLIVRIPALNHGIT